MSWSAFTSQKTEKPREFPSCWLFSSHLFVCLELNCYLSVGCPSLQSNLDWLATNQPLRLRTHIGFRLPPWVMLSSARFISCFRQFVLLCQLCPNFALSTYECSLQIWTCFCELLNIHKYVVSRQLKIREHILHFTYVCQSLWSVLYAMLCTQYRLLQWIDVTWNCCLLLGHSLTQSTHWKTKYANCDRSVCYIE